MDIRKFFGSPSARKPCADAKVNNNNGNTKKAGKPESVKNKIVTKAREVSKERKSTPQKSIPEKKKEQKKGKQEEDNDIEFVEEKISKKKRKSSSSDKERSVQNTNTKVTLEDSDDNEFEEIVQKSKTRKTFRSRKGILYDSDSEEEPIPKKSKWKSSEYQSVYIVDSDDENSKKKNKSPLKAFMKTNSAKKSVAEVKKKVDDHAKRTPVSASDFFGCDSVKRIERKVATKRKLETDDSPKLNNNEAEIHDDSDFEKTLDQLDQQETKAKKTRIEEKSPTKETTPSKSSLSSKLSSLAKSSKILVQETPEGKTKSDRRTSPRKSVSINTSATNKTPAKEGIKSTPSKASSLNSAEKTPPDKSPLEKKSSSGYRSFLHRDGPQSLGAKEFPTAEPNCLEGMTFVLTGVLESFERDEMKSHLEKYGGKVTVSISKKTSYVVVGRDAGESKLNKANQCGTKQVNEDELLELVKKLPGKRSKYEIQAEQEIKKEKAKALDRKFLYKEKPIEKQKSMTSPVVKSEQKPSSQSTSVSAVKVTESSDQSEPTLLWVDKYKPNSLKKIIGQTGDKSNANKLFHWLKNWHKNRSLGKKPTGGFFGKNDDGSGFRAALLSGPPGIGKTTTATLVCQESDFSYVELNASDTRSKKTLEHLVAESLNNQTLVDYMGDSKRSSSSPAGKTHCIIMDEVDGVAGNEDRGGIQELILMIKQTKIPIICICNDRNHQKMRSLVNHCFDLRFYKPRVEQIKGAMMSIIFREGLSIPPPALNEIILAANQDVRQVIHNLSMWCSTNKSITFEQAKHDSQKAKKDLKIGPFDVCRKVFEGGEEKRKMSVIDKSDLFFNDYSIAPLFVQENYIHVNPYSARGSVGKHLSQLARAADSICTGDLIEKQIRSQSKWGLLPMESIFASVIPGEEMQGGISQMIAFPSWLGKNSSQNKNDRILQELHTHMSLHISSDKRGLNMDYLPYMRKSLTDPLLRGESDGVKEVIGVMDGYNITKDDFDSVMDVSKWPNSSDPFSSLSSKTKAAFTRAYNKESHMTPYALGDGTKKKKGKVGGADDSQLLGEEGGGGAIVESEEEEEGVGNDGMVKMKKAPAVNKKTSASSKKASGKGKPTETKGKGRGKGKAKS